MGRIFILAMAFTALVSSAHAGDRCNEPYAPAIKLPPTATKQDLNSLRGDAEAFLTASDLYQKCLAAKGASDLQIHANQVLKQKIGADFNNVLHTFQASHPGA